jgi:hypothetical protein
MGKRRAAEPATCAPRGKQARKDPSAADGGAKPGRRSPAKSPKRARRGADPEGGAARPACPGCLQPFSSTGHRPLCVPACGHALCQACCGGRRRKCGECSADVKGKALQINRLADCLLAGAETSQAPDAGEYYDAKCHNACSAGAGGRAEGGEAGRRARGCGTPRVDLPGPHV